MISDGQVRRRRGRGLGVGRRDGGGRGKEGKELKERAKGGEVRVGCALNPGAEGKLRNATHLL